MICPQCKSETRSQHLGADCIATLKAEVARLEKWLAIAGQQTMELLVIANEPVDTLRAENQRLREALLELVGWLTAANHRLAAHEDQANNEDLLRAISEARAAALAGKEG